MGAEEGAMDLKDEQWAVLAPLIPRPHRRADGRGRPWREDREVLNGILWVLRTGAPWQDIPDRYPSPATCHRRFQHWVRGGVLAKILRALCGPDEAREGFKAHGSCGRPRSSSRRRRGQCFAS